MQTPIFVFAAYMLGLIVFSILAGLALGRFMGPLKELDSYVLEEPTPVIEYVAPATTAAMLKKAEARLQVHHDIDDLGPVALDRIRKFNDGVYEPMPVRTADGWAPADSRFWQKEFTAPDPTDDMPASVAIYKDTGITLAEREAIHLFEQELHEQRERQVEIHNVIEMAACRARAARLAIGEGDGLGEIWVLPAGSEWTEAQLDAVARAIDTEGVKS